MDRGSGIRIVWLVTVAVLFGPGVTFAEPTPRVIYVDAGASGAGDGSSWADAYIDLQDALDEVSYTLPTN